MAQRKQPLFLVFNLLDLVIFFPPSTTLLGSSVAWILMHFCPRDQTGTKFGFELSPTLKSNVFPVYQIQAFAPTSSLHYHIIFSLHAPLYHLVNPKNSPKFQWKMERNNFKKLGWDSSAFLNQENKQLERLPFNVNVKGVNVITVLENI